MAILSRLAILFLVGGLVPATGSILVSIGGVNETSLFQFPALTAGRNAYSLSGPVALPNGIGTITALTYSTFDDPIISYSMTGINLTNAPLPVLFTISNPYVGGPYNVLTDSFTLSVTDSNANGAVTVTTVAPQAVLSQPQVDGANRDGQGTGCALTSTPGFSSPCSTNLSTTISIPTTATAGTFGTVVSFAISPGDTYTFSGSTILSAVPEPATFSYMAGGSILFLAGFLRRRAAKI